VDVPLSLGLGFIALHVVGDVSGLDELAAGSPVVDPRPLGAPACAIRMPESSEYALCLRCDSPPLIEALVVVDRAAGLPAFELPPAIPPTVCASEEHTANVDASARAASFMDSSWKLMKLIGQSRKCS